MKLIVNVHVDSCTIVVDNFWTLFFDGSKTSEGSGADCVLIDLEKNKHFLSCRLEFECTNNTAKYEVLVQGLRKAIELKANNLKVFGDSEIIVKQIRNQIHCISPHLKSYQNEALGSRYDHQPTSVRQRSIDYRMLNK